MNVSIDYMIDVDLELILVVSDSDLSSLEIELWLDVEIDVCFILLLYEGFLKIVFEMFGGYFYWFLNYFFISKNVLFSLLYYEYYNVLFEGNNLLLFYE